MWPVEIFAKGRLAANLSKDTVLKFWYQSARERARCEHAREQESHACHARGTRMTPCYIGKRGRRTYASLPTFRSVNGQSRKGACKGSKIGR